MQDLLERVSGSGCYCNNQGERDSRQGGEGGEGGLMVVNIQGQGQASIRSK